MQNLRKLFSLRRLLPLVATSAALSGLTSCADFYYYGPSTTLRGQTQYMEGYDPGLPRGQQFRQTDSSSWWRGDGVPGPAKVVISLGQQRAFFYKGGELVGESAISSGDEQHPTPTGRYSISQKNADHKSSQYGDYVDSSGNVVVENIDRHSDPQPPGTRYDGAIMPYFMRFTGGIGMHAGYLPGYPASHGCVRMPRDMAQAFFRNLSVGTPVEVVY
ncbi:L,D-transpeptidase family protein [Verrucomicrobium sp. BvORR034]|jgi:lipoprotein-anchoring transpeptidase ErfK/SrfK|uniref:L,D-transpeptidase family protein n=1 Tax=Verrucomicrobium sp. BvORR034 TaxID=1396418 RepID=UPI000679133D|nr:L,D-transpeptidase family protein [Verrucomicrobium sp. BvORR034]